MKQENTLHIITPVSRPALLPQALTSIEPGTRLFDIVWWTVYDTRFALPPVTRITPKVSDLHIRVAGVMNHHSIVGNAQNNYALEHVPPYAWCYFLSDDNAMHPDFFKHLHAAIRKQPDKQAFIFHQQVNPYGGCRVAALDRVKLEQIDLAQFVLKRSFIGNEQFQLNRYQSDGVLIEALNQRHPEKFALIDQVMSYYNRLRW